MKAFLNSVANIGISPELPFSRQNKIRIFNTAILGISIICIFYAVFSFFKKEYITVLLSFNNLVFTFFALLLIHKRKHELAFHFGLITGLVFVAGVAIIFGEQAQSHIYFLFIPIGCTILFDKYRTYIFYFILSMVFFLVCRYIFEHYEPVYPNSGIIKIRGIINFIFTGGLIFLGVRQFKTENKTFTDKIDSQRLELEEKNKDITDSINYAQKIQAALMASDSFLQKNLNEYFIYYKPKDIVSGDFYWAEKSGTRFLFSVCDCTGHGVPGAFMSLLNISKLNETVNDKKITSPDHVFNRVRERIVKALNPQGTEEERKDGMDAVLCSFDFENLKLDFTCANNPLWLIRNENGQTILHEYKTNKMPVGVYSGPKNDFTLHSLDLQKGDCIYIFTDGYADQFGGSKGKKFKYAQLKELLLSINHLPMPKQQMQLQKKIISWKGELEQVDDILVAGIRV